MTSVVPNLDECLFKEIEVSRFPPRYMIQFLFVRTYNLSFTFFTFELGLNWPCGHHEGSLTGPVEGAPPPSPQEMHSGMAHSPHCHWNYFHFLSQIQSCFQIHCGYWSHPGSSLPPRCCGVKVQSY